MPGKMGNHQSNILLSDAAHWEAADRVSIIQEYWRELGALHPWSKAAIAAGGKAGSPNRPRMWLIYNDRVVDCSRWQMLHPGGSSVLVSYAGRDCTKAFDDTHPTATALAKVEQYTIARVYTHPEADVPESFNACAESIEQVNEAIQSSHRRNSTDGLLPMNGGTVAAPLSPASRIQLLMEQAKQLSAPGYVRPSVRGPFGRHQQSVINLHTPAAVGSSSDVTRNAGPNVQSEPREVKCNVTDRRACGSRLVTVTLESVDGVQLDLVPGGHVSIRVASDTWRPYSPVHQSGARFSLVVKQYAGGVGGSYIAGLRPGDQCDVRGPLRPSVDITADFLTATGGGPAAHIVLVAGGTGAAPILQMAKSVAARSAGEGHICTVLLCFRDRDDSMLLSDFENLHSAAASRINVVVFFSRDGGAATQLPRPPTLPQWRSQRLSTEAIRAAIAKTVSSRGGSTPSPRRLVGVCCGPVALNDACYDMFVDAGVPDDAVFIL